MRYLRNSDGAGPRTPNLEPIQTIPNEDEDTKSVGIGEVFTGVGRDEVDKLSSRGDNLLGSVATQDSILSRRSLSLESRFDSFDSNSSQTKNSNNNISSNTTTTTMQLSSMGGTNTKHLPRKLPALEVKANSMKKGKQKKRNNFWKLSHFFQFFVITENIDNCRPNKSRAKTAFCELSSSSHKNRVGGGGGGEHGVTLSDGNVAANRAITLLETRKILTRSNDLLGQSSTEKLIDMLKEHAGLKECTDETVNHINSVRLKYQYFHEIMIG